MKKMHFLAGLPRSGSTLLTSILYQNPMIHTEGHSALCATMWATLQSLESDMHLRATRTPQTIQTIVSAIPKLYYVDNMRDVVLDKSFTWTLSGNIEMIKRFVTPNPKFIVMERPLNEIVDSFVRLMERSDSNGVFQSAVDVSNGGTLRERREKAITIEDGALANELRAYKTAKEYPDQSLFYYVSYHDLVSDAEGTLDRIYNFLELPTYKHDLDNIINHHQENDKVWGLGGMHVVRPKIEKIVWQQ